MQISSESYENNPLTSWRMSGEVFAMLPCSEFCSVPSLSVSAFSFCSACLNVCSLYSSKEFASNCNSPLLSIMIKRSVLKHLVLLVDSVIQV